MQRLKQLNLHTFRFYQVITFLFSFFWANSYAMQPKNRLWKKVSINKSDESENIFGVGSGFSCFHLEGARATSHRATKWNHRDYSLANNTRMVDGKKGEITRRTFSS